MKVFPDSLFVRFAVLVIFSLAGCGGGTPAPATTTPENAPPASAASTAPAAPPAAAASPATAPPAPAAAVSETGVDPEHKETKWIGKIPYDVFYDQPLAIATDTTAIGSPAPSAPAANPSAMANPPAAAATANTAPATSTGGANANWKEIIPAPILNEEVKLLRTRLTSNLQTVATFNKATKPIALDASILTAMAAVVTVDADDINWKPKAHFVRDLAFEIASSSEGSGREPFTKCKEPFEKITNMLDGGKPPEIDSKETVPFAEVVYVADMMKRIEISFNNLKSNFSTEAKLKGDQPTAERELRILMTLGTMMKDPSYDNADATKYQDFLKRFIGGTEEGVKAVKANHVEGLQAALNEIQKTCAECHQEYRGSGTGF
jgi:hypothetical protein